MIQPGAFYKLRNGMDVFVTKGYAYDMGTAGVQHGFFGIATVNGLNCSWDEAGRYLDTGAAHPLDILLTDPAIESNPIV